eukprot:EG_transcript_32696
MHLPPSALPSIIRLDGDGPPATALQLPGAKASKPPAREDKGDQPRVCLDYLKGRCVRRRCRFAHPDLSDYRQLSGAVQAQAGRQVCEVWAMTGQCKFGPKCSKLHPYIIPQPQPTPPVEVFCGPVRPAPSTAAPPQWPLLPTSNPPGPGSVARPSLAPPSEPPPIPMTVQRPAHVHPFSLRPASTPASAPRDPIP